MPPRPRPRPRPANRQASDQAQHAASSVMKLAKSDRELELDKGDEYFIRNRNRSAKDWKKLDDLTKGEFGYLVDAHLARLTHVL